MKKVLIAVLAVCLIISASAFSQVDVKGQMLASGYGGYTLGFGDPFGDTDYSYSGVTATSSYSAGIGFGGMFHYGITEKLMIGGEIGFQSYKAEVDIPGQTVMGVTIPGVSESTTSTENNILGNCLYAMSYEDESALFLTFGGGIYGGGDSEIGFFGGILYRKAFGNIQGFIMPRFHYVMTDTAMKMFQIAAGVQFPIGG